MNPNYCKHGINTGLGRESAVSILLEALRKSEKKQRSREVPTIHSEVPSSQPSRFSGRVPLLILLAVTLVVSGWFVWQQYRAPASEGLVSAEANPGISSPVAEQSSTSAVEASAPALETNGSTSETDSGGSGPLAVDGNSPSPRSPGIDDSQQKPRSRTPMESYQPPVSDTTNTAGQESNKKRRASPDPDQNKQVSALRPIDSSSPAKNSGSGEPSEAISPKPERRSSEPEPISYWELPDSIRTDVPEIKYTVLVYNTNPAERFVLINGERLAEGESYQPGLVVKEIRRDGVIFSYRLYQFLVKR